LSRNFVGNDREGLEPPETVFLLVDILRHLEAHQMADGGRDDVFVVLVVVGFLRDFAERAGQVGGDRGLLGNDETLHAGDEPLAAPRRISSNTFSGAFGFSRK
jgi:hypothetical protein